MLPGEAFLDSSLWRVDKSDAMPRRSCGSRSGWNADISRHTNSGVPDFRYLIAASQLPMRQRIVDNIALRSIKSGVKEKGELDLCDLWSRRNYYQLSPDVPQGFAKRSLQISALHLQFGRVISLTSGSVVEWVHPPALTHDQRIFLQR